MEERYTRGKFIRLGAAVGAGAAGASVLAACGGGGEKAGVVEGGDEKEVSSPAEGQETPGAVQGAEEVQKGKTVAQVEEGAAIAGESDVPPGSAIEFTDEESGQPAVLVRLDDGDFRAYSAICTHRQCVVGYADGDLACPCHGSVFDAANEGAVLNGPATEPLPEIPVEVQDGQVFRA